MTKHYVKVTPTFTIEETTRLMQEKQQSCVLVVDNEDFLEGIVTLGDLRRKGFVPSENSDSTQANSSTVDVCNCSYCGCNFSPSCYLLIMLAIHTFTWQLRRQILLLCHHASLEVSSSMATKEDW